MHRRRRTCGARPAWSCAASPGETIARRILRDDAYRRAREVLAGQLGAFAAGLHALRVPAGLPAPDPVAELRATYASFGLAAARSSSWRCAALEASPPPPAAPVLVHGDLRLGNLIVGPDVAAGRAGLGAGARREPGRGPGLAVRQGLALRRRAARRRAWGRREDLLAAYRAAGGADISLDELRWWEILGTLRWGVICMTQARAHLSGAHRSVELAAIGRRVCEQEWDLLAAARAGGRGAGRRARVPAGAGRPAAAARAARPPASCSMPSAGT